ncbi:hypothetical protein [Photobacterium galatheae]|uniref:SWIM-type domain-containing protein n=1 Tax=Photobacterium galatheae TaxID=1654360 RepID=A0A066RMH9_9GAMM|nr:hypothetical protein [Photobacterium galatheae]KDM90316.1 hypothetical protein EA58_17625 [Photobacterium galatheae]MCM0150803.1 hypothetical protein [Photobacterium galatheae]
MSLSDWTRQLTDEYLINWTSKGLFRRAGKIADKHPGISPADPSLPLTLSIDNFDVTLADTDLAQFSCQCGTLGSCVHQLAFLLKLRELNENETAPPAEPFQPERWCITSREALDQTYGRGNATQAIKLYQKGALVTFEPQTDHCVVNVTLQSQKSYLLHLPATGEWSAVLCSCKETACVHRALAILMLSITHNTFSAESEAAFDTLNPEQAELVSSVLNWLQTLTQTGTAELLQTQVDQGAGYCTELNQADLPRPAALLSGVIESLRQILKKYHQASHTRLLDQVAETLLHLHALSQPVLPQPLSVLAGQHRRLYRPQPKMTLIGLHVVFWDDQQGGRGFRYYCYDPQLADFYTVSSSRRHGIDPSWSPHQGFHDSPLGTYPLSAVTFRTFEFAGATSEDGSINASQTRSLKLGQPVSIQMLSELPAISIQAQWQRLAARLAAPTAPAHRDYLGWVVSECRQPFVFYPSIDRWRGECQSPCGSRITVEIPAPEWTPDIQKRWDSADEMVLFGRWQIGSDAPRLQLISLLNDTLIQETRKEYLHD